MPEARKRESIDFLAWGARVLGWDACLPIVVSIASIGIAGLLDRKPPADIIAMAGLPAIAFAFRYVVGTRQIRRNHCGAVFRGFQLVALVTALLPLAIADFLIALSVFVPKKDIPGMQELLPLYAAIFSVYLTLVTFAMYPGRRPVEEA